MAWYIFYQSILSSHVLVLSIAILVQGYDINKWLWGFFSVIFLQLQFYVSL